MFVVDRGIPEAKRRSVGSQAVWHKKYPFDQMGVGDSFLMPFDPSTTPSNLQTRVYEAAKVWGMRVKTRTVEDGVRVWRTA